jgi:hypothetical protein
VLDLLSRLRKKGRLSLGSVGVGASQVFTTAKSKLFLSLEVKMIQGSPADRIENAECPVLLSLLLNACSVLLCLGLYLGYFQ